MSRLTRVVFLLLLLVQCPTSRASSRRIQIGSRIGRRFLKAIRAVRGGEASNFTLTSSDNNLQDVESSDDEETSEEPETKAFFNKIWSRFVPKLESTQFLDRIAMVSTSLLQREDSSLEQEEHMMVYNETFLRSVTPQSDLTRPGRYIHVVTTAALPWFTGTAVNPLLRAAYLHRRTLEINRHENATEAARKSWVILVIPWLELREDQELLYGQVFPNTTQQELYIRNWLRKEANMPDVADALEIVFYPARYHTELGSIFAMGDMMKQLDQRKMDVAILEEPEHVNWFRAPGDGWTQRFPYVVDYKEYAASHYSGLWTAPALAMISSAMVRAYCHKGKALTEEEDQQPSRLVCLYLTIHLPMFTVIKLSDTLQTYAPDKECTSNVHGVRSEFIEEGIRRSQATLQQGITNSSTNSSHKVYFIGKLLWAKGLDKMLELQEYYRQYTGEYFHIDIYGSGPESKEIQRAFHGRQRESKGEADSLRDLAHRSLQELAQLQLSKLKETIPLRTFAEFRKDPVPATFPGRVDHATLKEDYTVFINPSFSEVLCTTTFEALASKYLLSSEPFASFPRSLRNLTRKRLAVGKFAIIPYHPSNMFFLRFPNALIYRDPYEFVANVRWAMNHEPEPLTEDQVREFTWEAATDRLVHAASITHGEALEREKVSLRKIDERIAWFHNEIGKGPRGDLLRKVFGAGPVSYQVYARRKWNLRHVCRGNSLPERGWIE
eukprot:scaffold1087_cov154-Amphora_coffeaeformis.AAC.2